jgi:hypothetical protein
MKPTIILAVAAFILLSCLQSGKENACPAPNMVIVDAPSNYVMKGDTFRAKIIPINTRCWQDQITLGKTSPVVKSYWENGILNIASVANKSGFVSLSGTINLKSPTIDTSLDFSTTYVVANPIVSAYSTALIMDMANPVEISIAGIAPPFTIKSDDVTIEGSGVKYKLTPHKPGPLKVNVSSADGSISYGSIDFMVYEKK